VRQQKRGHARNPARMRCCEWKDNLVVCPVFRKGGR
jgi:hypothetical protein